MTSLVGLSISGPVAPWQAIGLRVVDGRAWVGGIALHIAGDDGPTQMLGWVLADSPDRTSSIDGVATTHVELAGPADPSGPDDLQSWEHPLGATSFDHVVVMTSSLDRTCGEIERVTGEPLKRIREAGPIRQGFHRLGSMIVEVVESDRVTAPVASLWGFVWIVDDLHEVADRLGPDLLSPPKPAVQPGRYIASFRGAAGLQLPIALMTPDRR
jgi:hypothetical protein